MERDVLKLRVVRFDVERLVDAEELADVEAELDRELERLDEAELDSE